MESDTDPVFYCPIRSAINPRVADAERYATQWAREQHLIAADDAWGVGPARIGYLASYANPWGSWDALKITVEWLDWLMVYDDAIVDKRINVSKLDEPTIRRLHARVIDILRGSAVTAGEEPLLRAVGAIRQSIVRLCPDWDMAEFIAGFGHYLQSNLWEATNIWSAQPAHLSAYTNMRRHTGCLFPTYRLGAAICGIFPGPEVCEHVAIQQLEIMANNYTCWLNDVYSYERELRDGQVNNLVAVLRREFECDTREAADRAVGMCRIEMDSYLELKDRLPLLGVTVDPVLEAYLDVVESWIRALFDWHKMTGRYRVPSQAATSS
ncbi:MAG: terpene synthase family protein [Streptosporangiaceae bacterium]